MKSHCFVLLDVNFWSISHESSCTLWLQESGQLLVPFPSVLFFFFFKDRAWLLYISIAPKEQKNLEIIKKLIYVFESCSLACVLQSGNDFLVSIKQVESENRWDNHAWMEVHDITFKIYGFQAWGGIGPQGMCFMSLQSSDVGPYLAHISVIQRFETLNDGLIRMPKNWRLKNWCIHFQRFFFCFLDCCRILYLSIL